MEAPAAPAQKRAAAARAAQRLPHEGTRRAPLRALYQGSTDDDAPGWADGLIQRPFGRVLDPSALETFAPSHGRVVVELPWARHHRRSSLLSAEPSWFEQGEETGGGVDPRRLVGGRGRRLRLGHPSVREGYAGWLAEKIADLGERGADHVQLPEADEAPPSFWSALFAALPKAAPRLVAETAAPRSLDGEGFSALLDRTGDLDCHGLRTPLLFSARGVASGLEDRLAASLVTHDGFVLSDSQHDALPPGLPERLAALHDELARKGPVHIRRHGRAVARFDRDPRSAAHAVAAGPSHQQIIRILGGRFVSLQNILSSSGTRILRGQASADQASDRAAQSKDRLRLLAPERVAIENPYPRIDGGRFPAKRIVGDMLEVGADIFCDGHEKLAADLIVTEPGGEPVRIPMKPVSNDRWTARHLLTRMGLASFDIEAWRDQYASWLDEVSKKRQAGKEVRLETIEGARLVLPQLEKVAEKGEQDRAPVYLKALRETEEGSSDHLRVLTDKGLYDLLREHGDRTQAVRLPSAVPVRVDREQARFSSWYELFPRSMSGDESRHGTFRDVIERLPYIQDLGFDVLYFPPIHPIGKTNRKGRNNTLTPDEHDVGSPYAIGSKDGGHDALHPELGTFEDFAALIEAAQKHGMEIALDFAIQCSPDHPWLKEHEEWFDWRPDGTIKFAENPPKKYEDIVNVHFYRDALPQLWYALKDVVLFWCEQGVRMFRVDNPHTKPYPFWEWMIGEVKAQYPDALFLSEAFTRPKVMKRLAKLGFTQSYTYFTWRNTKDELSDYVRELTRTESRDVMNPNFFVNTPDINPAVLQTNNRDAYIARTWLAGTLASSYGIYNGVEIAEGTPLPGKEEYLDSEKYQIRVWDMDREGHIKDEIRLLNKVRAEHPALRDHVTYRPLTAHNDQIMWYAKATPDLSDVVLFAVSLDFERDQRATVEVPLWYYGLSDDAEIEAYDIFADRAFTWKGKMQEVTLGPGRIVRAFALKAPPGFEGPNEVLYEDREEYR
jgi:starch synthase (maltosyl-transferring)